MAEAKDLNYLLDNKKYTEDSDFVVACYKDLLGRVPGINELFDAVCQLSGGMPRKVYLASIALSPEFGGRFDIANVSEYRLTLKKYGISKKFERKIIGIKDTEDIVSVRFSLPIKDLYPEINTTEFDSEFSALNNCQMDSLRQYLEKNYGLDSGDAEDNNVSCFGEFAGELLPAAQNVSELEIGSDASCGDKLFISSPSAIDFVLRDENLTSASRTVKDSLLFTMPCIPGSDAPVSAVFDKHWRAFDPTARFDERFSTGADAAGIYLINNTDDTFKARVSFKAICFKAASLIISQAQNTYELVLDKPSKSVSVDLFLLPGYNPISFTYVGVPYRSEVTGGEPVRFSIRDLSITLPGVSERTTSDSAFVLTGADAYKLDTMTHGDGYYQYLKTDRRIRFMLHEHGFFEVKSVRFYDDYSVVEEDTSRYLEFRYGDLDTNFQIHKKAQDAGKGASRASVRLYIAKRAGAI